jgi:hypothetical protein
MNRKFIGSLAAIVSILAWGFQNVPAYFIDRVFSDPAQIPAWIPIIETVGGTVLVYTSAADVVGALVPVGLALAFGYAVGGRIDVASEYPKFVKTVVAGSLLPGVIAWGLLLVLGNVSPSFSVGSLLVGSGFMFILKLVAESSVMVVIGAFAGAALAHFRSSDDTPVRPTTADDTTAASPPTADTAPDDEYQRSQPTR